MHPSIHPPTNPPKLDLWSANIFNTNFLLPVENQFNFLIDFFVMCVQHQPIKLSEMKDLSGASLKELAGVLSG
jgi:hypothetical protein